MSVPDQDSNPGLNLYSKKHLTVGLHSNYSGRSPGPSGRPTPSFLKHRHFNVLTVRTVNRTMIRCQSAMTVSLHSPEQHAVCWH
jgi:hypothetical protein